VSVSLDGYYAGPLRAGDDVSDMQSWPNAPEAAGCFRVTRWVIDAEAWRQTQPARRSWVGGWRTAVRSRRELEWRPAHSSWREGFASA